MAVKEGDLVRWMLPLDHDYSYGKIDKVNNNRALVTHTKGYHAGTQTEVHVRYIKKEAKKRGNKAKRGRR